MSYICFQQIDEPYKQHGSENKLAPRPSSTVPPRVSGSKSLRGKAIATIYSSPVRCSDQSCPPTVYASLPSGLTVPRNSVPKSYLRTDALSPASGRSQPKAPSRVAKSKAKVVTIIDNKPCPRCPGNDKRPGKEAYCQKCDGRKTTPSSALKPALKSKPRPWWAFWRRPSAQDNNDPDVWLCFGS